VTAEDKQTYKTVPEPKKPSATEEPTTYQPRYKQQLAD